MSYCDWIMNIYGIFSKTFSLLDVIPKGRTKSDNQK